MFPIATTQTTPSSNTTPSKSNQFQPATTQPPTTPLNQNKEQQLKSLNKLVSSCLKSLKYMEQLVSKRKHDIYATAVTHLIESLFDVYNLVKTFKFAKCAESLGGLSGNLFLVKSHRDIFHDINVSLAQLVKWCDGEYYFGGENESGYDGNGNGKVEKKANELNTNLTMCLLELVHSLKKYYFLSESESTNNFNRGNTLFYRRVCTCVARVRNPKFWTVSKIGQKGIKSPNHVRLS
jgi:hypothetical protein